MLRSNRSCESPLEFRAEARSMPIEMLASIPFVDKVLQVNCRAYVARRVSSTEDGSGNFRRWRWRHAPLTTHYSPLILNTAAPESFPALSSSSALLAWSRGYSIE